MMGMGKREGLNTMYVIDNTKKIVLICLVNKFVSSENCFASF